MICDVLKLMRFAEFTDSALPVGAFSFSCGLETAAEIGLVFDAASLEAYVENLVRQAASTDALAAICAHRACLDDDYDGVRNADSMVWLSKMNAESRTMTLRMGKKLGELAGRLIKNSLLDLWMNDMNDCVVRGTYPISQAIVFSACGIDEQSLFASHIYGVMNTVLSASLRCIRVSHYQTQQIIFKLSESIPYLYSQVRTATIDDMNTFAPQTDILASLHEKGTKRMFMN